MAPEAAPASWTRPETWHLTLRFLGEIDEEAATRFADAIGDAASIPEVALPPGGPVVLPPHGKARVVGIGFEPGTGIEALAGAAEAAERAARAIGCAAEDRPFRPHVTLARLREPWRPGAVESFREAVRAWSFPVWRVRAIVLSVSRLHPAGAVHTVRREWPVVGQPAGKTA